jgi:hypothetical protein
VVADTARRAWAYSALTCAIACGRAERPATAARGTLPDSISHVGFGVRSELLTRRVRLAEVVADTALLAESGVWVQFRGVRVAFFGAAGDTIGRLTAVAGTYDVRGRRLTLRGDVTLRTGDGRRLTAPRVAYDIARGRLVGDTAFRYVGPDRERSGQAFEAGPALRDLRTVSAREAARVGPRP